MNGDKYNIVLPEFKYYNGEDNDKCPYSSDDVRSHFWWGEMMFSQLRDLDVKFEEYEKDVLEWRKWLLEHKPNQAAHLLNTNSTRQLCIAYYIVLLFGKWWPHDDQEWIFEY